MKKLEFDIRAVLFHLFDDLFMNVGPSFGKDLSEHRSGSEEPSGWESIIGQDESSSRAKDPRHFGKSPGPIRDCRKDVGGENPVEGCVRKRKALSGPHRKSPGSPSCDFQETGTRIDADNMGGEAGEVETRSASDIQNPVALVRL